jgi:hypothetical protein
LRVNFRVVAVGWLVAAVVGGDQRVERFGADAGVVVGREMLHGGDAPVTGARNDGKRSF